MQTFDYANVVGVQKRQYTIWDLCVWGGRGGGRGGGESGGGAVSAEIGVKSVVLAT